MILSRSFIVSAGLMLAVAFQATATTIHVPGDFPTIQGAINASMDGDEIIVAPGTYDEVIDFNGKAVHLHSSDGPEETIIDSGEFPLFQRAVTASSGEGPDAVLEGFTIHTDEFFGGGGVEIGVGSALHILNCIFDTNVVAKGHGGAIWNAGSLIVEGSSFVDNAAGGDGGTGVFWGFGGAIYNTGDAEIIDCEFESNRVTLTGEDVTTYGGAIAHDGSTLTVTNSQFVDNQVDAGTSWEYAATFSRGGAVYISSGVVAFSDCDFDGNRATASGGEGSSVHSRGGAIAFIGGNLEVENCSFAGNFVESNIGTSLGGAIFVGPAPPPPWIGGSAFCQNTPGHVNGPWEDLGGNAFGPYCPAGDLTGDGTAGVDDLLILLAEWGDCADPADCPADLTGDGAVGVDDLLILLANWG